MNGALETGEREDRNSGYLRDHSFLMPGVWADGHRANRLPKHDRGSGTEGNPLRMATTKSISVDKDNFNSTK